MHIFTQYVADTKGIEGGNLWKLVIRLVLLLEYVRTKNKQEPPMQCHWSIA